MVPRPEETPAEPFRQGLIRREPAAPPRAESAPRPTPPAAPAPPRPAANPRPGTFDLAAWVFGLVPRSDDDGPAPPPRRSPPPKRKALTMPDLFEGGAMPPCLEDD
ncbi:MAG: hypothetical protein M9894_29605 [Planctomycetes bacterium]|nr:hypothetical protein [Planctomycetota bacterium]